VKVFLDSNVIVSGIAFRGPEFDLLRSSFASRHVFVISEDVQGEVRGVLRRQFPRFQEEAEEILALFPIDVVPREAYAARLGDFPALRDPKDAHVLAAALEAECDLIATGDQDLLVLGQLEGTKIERSARVLRLLRGTADP